MNAKTMEGIAGAGTNMNLLRTPMRVYKEARRRGDTAVMERAMGYVGEFADKAQEYKAEADKGMEEDAREARERAKAEQEKAVRRRKEEREKLEERIEENRSADTAADTVEFSEEGKVLLKDNMDFNRTGLERTDLDHTDLGYTGVGAIKADARREPVTYTNTGEVRHTEQSEGISISV